MTVTQFTPETYQLEIPGMDGYKAQKLTLSVGGSVELDTTSAEDVEFVNGLKLGDRISLKCTAIVTKKGFTLTPNDDKGDAAGYGVGFKVDSVEVT